MPDLIRRVCAYIEQNLGGTVRVGDLARVAGLSYSHFIRVFRRSTGYSPRAYLMRKRLDRAAHLLKSTADSLADIAVTCGLSDQAHLCKRFRQMVGESPGSWRRRHISRPLAPGADDPTRPRPDLARQHRHP